MQQEQHESFAEALAAERLTAYRATFLYADHQLFKRREYVTLARQLARRADLGFRTSIGICLYALVRFAFEVIRYADRGTWPGLVIAFTLPAVAIAMVAGAAHHRGRTREMRDTIEALLPAPAVTAHAR